MLRASVGMLFLTALEAGITTRDAYGSGWCPGSGGDGARLPGRRAGGRRRFPLTAPGSAA